MRRAGIGTALGVVGLLMLGGVNGTARAAIGVEALACNGATGVDFSITLPNDVARGSAIVVAVSKVANDTIAPSVSDSAGNSYSLAAEHTHASFSDTLRTYLATNVTAVPSGGTIDIQPGSNHEIDACAIEVTGVKAAPVDQTAAASGASTAPNSGSATTTQANEVLVGANYWFDLDGAGASSASPGSSYTEQLERNAGDSASLQVQTRIVSSTGSYDSAATLTSSEDWIASMVTLEERPQDSDGDVTASGTITEPVGIPTTADTSGEAVGILDFAVTDGGSTDGLSLDISEIRMDVGGTADASKLNFLLDGPDVSGRFGSLSGGVLTFSSLGISVADGTSEVYTVSAYYADNTGLTEDQTVTLVTDGDTDFTVDSLNTQMGSTTPVDNGTGSTVDVTATGLAFSTQPAGSVSGSALTTQPVVAARDAFGNADVDFTETVTLTESSPGTLTNNTAAASSGVATFTGLTYTATADQESFTLTANDEDGTGSDLPTVDANSVTSDVVATQLQFTTQPQPQKVARGDPTSFTTVPAVAAVDGNLVRDTGYATDITLAEVNGAGSAQLTGSGDTDGDASTVTLTPSSGLATYSGLTITYTPSGGGAETFNLQAASGGLASAASATLTVNREPGFDSGTSVSLDVNEDGGAVSIDGLLAVTDADTGDTLTWSVAAAPSKGSLGGFSTAGTSDGGSVTPSGLTYTPNADATGADAFDVQVNDGFDTDLVTVNVTINDQPTVTLTSSESDPTNTSPFDVAVDFSESVTGFAAGDIVVGNGSVDGLSGSGASYTASIAPAADGTVTVDVPAAVATDSGGADNEAATQFSIEYDGTDPGAPSVPDLDAASDTGASSTDDITSATTLTLSGTAEADVTVELSSDLDGALGSVAADGSGNWTFTTPSAVSEGVHSITAVATDDVGNTGPASTALSVTVDTTAPPAPPAPDLAAASDTGDSDSDDLTGDTTPTLTGTAEADAEVTVTSDQDGSIGSAAADGSGNWSLTPAGALSEATHAITATATDVAGNTSGTSAALSVTIDTTTPSQPPAPDLAAASDSGDSDTDDLTNETLPTLTGTAEADAEVAVTSDQDGPLGNTTADGAGNWSLTPSGPLSEAAHAITTTVTDAAGNTSAASAALSVTVDVTPPGTPSQPGLDPASDTGDADGVTSDTTPTLEGTADADVTVLVDSDRDGQLGSTTADGSGAWQLTPAGAMSEGDHAVTAAARDAAGNTSGDSPSLAVTIDATAPGAPAAPAVDTASDTGVSDSDAVTRDLTPTLTGSVEPNVDVTVQSDLAGQLGTATADGSGQWQFTPSGDLAEGVHQITITVTDGAGQTSPDSAALAMTLDATAPAAPSPPALDPSLSGASTGTTQERRPPLVGTAEPDTRVTVFSDRDGPLGSAPSDGSGGWQMTPSADLSLGDHSLTAEAADAAGNTSETSEPALIHVNGASAHDIPVGGGVVAWLLITGIGLLALAHRRRLTRV